MSRRALSRAAISRAGISRAGIPRVGISRVAISRAAIGAVAALSVAGGLAGGAGGQPAEPDVYRATLPNGLRVVVRERPGSEVVAISVGIRGGSRDEEAETVGAAHFMEHMFFQGTPRRPDSADIDRDIEARGGWTNAWTGWESINFQVVAPREGFDLALDIIADQMTASLFAAEKVDKERQVVLEELNGRLNNPASRSFDLFLPAVFGDHPARHLPIGNRETIGQSTREVLVRFRDTYFVAGNMVVAVVGDVDHAQVVAQVGAAFADLRTGPVPPFKAAPVPAAVARTIEESSPARQARIVLGGPAPGYDSPDRYALHVATALLGAAGRRLENEIVDRRGLASSVGPFYEVLTDVGVWGVWAGMAPGNVDAVLDLARAELRRLADEPVSAEDLAEAIAYIRGSTLLNRERTVALAEELADGEVLGIYESLDEFLARVAAVTAADVRRVAAAHLRPDDATLVILRP